MRYGRGGLDGPRLRLLALCVVAIVVAGGLVLTRRDDTSSASGAALPPATDPATEPTTSIASETTVAPTTTVPPTTTLPPYDGWVNPASSGRPWSETVPGMLTFRGNPTRSWYGTGPVPRETPAVLWRYPRSGGLCGPSSASGVTKVWCGTGWTGQANVWENPRDGRTWLAFGAYDHAYHFLDPATGERLLPPLPTGDINKGSATVDPDGFPLYYAGSRDNHLRVIALDRPEPTVLWSLRHDAVSPTLWNSDWDGAPMIVGDFLLEGGENSQFHVVKLNRGYGPDGLVTVQPQLVFNAPGWDEQLLRDIGDREVSIENSVAVSGNVAYFANSGGLVQGWDISGLEAGVAPQRVFRFWTGDDTDATIAIDDEGFLYVASEYQRFNQRSRDVGQLMKLDPRRPDDPLVWSLYDHDYRGFENAAGIWSTPAIVGDVIVTTTNGGRVLGLDRATGAVLWSKQLAAPVWQSPVVVDGVLVQGDCNGVLRAFDLANPPVDPPLLWEVELGGCIESTPTVWKGRIYVGTRAGGFFALGTPGT